MGQLCGYDEFGAIPDRYRSSNLVIGIDYTASNASQGKRTFGGRCLHHLMIDGLNPYQKVIQIVGRTLSKFDEDDLIPVFGFGDVTTKDNSVFEFRPDPSVPRYCHGFEEVLQVYNRVTQTVRLSGPTNYAPVINRAIQECLAGPRTEYVILVIIADGQVTNEKETVEAIKNASNYPLSIVVVGVGDGPWDEMEYFDDRIKGRRFDNFQFVDYSDVVTRARRRGIDPDIAFSVMALMEIPQQFRCIKKLGLLGRPCQDGRLQY